TAHLDRAVNDLVWSPNEAGKQRIFYGTEEKANTVYYVANLDPNDNYTREYNAIISQGTNGSLTISRDGKVHGHSRVFLHSPAEVWVAGTAPWLNRDPNRAENHSFNTLNVSQANAALLNELNLPKPEYVTFPVDSA